MNKIKTLPLILASVACLLASTASAQVTNVGTTNLTHTVTNRAAAASVPEMQVPMVLSSLRFVVTNDLVMGANIAADQLVLDVPGSSRKMCSYLLDPAAWYVVETKVTVAGGILQTKRQQPITGITDLSPNLPRNQFTGEYDSYKIFLVPTPSVPPRVPGEVTTP